MLYCPLFAIFFFNDPATTEIYTLSLHDALPISAVAAACARSDAATARVRSASCNRGRTPSTSTHRRSEEHTSELQSQFHLVCRLLLEKKKNRQHHHTTTAGTPQPRDPNQLENYD